MTLRRDYATKEELENAGGGGGGGKLVVTATETADTLHLALDKNYSEISAAIKNNESVIINNIINDDNWNIFSVTSIYAVASENRFTIGAVGGASGSPLTFSATSPTGVLMADID